MELLDGESLASRLKKTPVLPVSSLANIGKQIASAVGAAHAHGIVHRDLKPDNVFLVPDPEVAGGERAKILDFGIAKLAGGELRSQSAKTKTGSIIGTPAYMSPEQCRGAGHIDLRADIYSLGCILFELACGRAPFVGEGMGEVLGQHQFVDAPSPRTFNPSIPRKLETVILKSLKKEPNERQQSMAEVASELEPLINVGELRARKQSLIPFAATLPPSGISNPVTTLGGAIGEQRPSVHAPRRSRRGLFFALGGAVVVVAGVVIAVTVGSKSDSTEQAPPPTPTTTTSAAVAISVASSAPGDLKLATAEKALGAGDWDGARLAAASVIEVDASNARAAKIRDTARDEERTELVFEALDKSVGAKDLAGAVKSFQEIPETSFYRKPASEKLDELRGPWRDAKLNDARALAAKGKCDGIDAIGKEISAMYPETADPGTAAIKATCTGKAPTPPVTPPPSTPTVDVDATIAEAKQALSSGDYQGVVKKVDQALKADPGNGQALLLGAIAGCRLGSHDLAARYAKGLSATRLTSVKQVCAENGIEL
jgi:hypothetical protein